MNKLFTLLITLTLLTPSFILQAQGTYYDNVETQVASGLECMPLKQTLHDLIDEHTARSYTGVLPEFMCTYDVDNNGIIIDRYKNTSETCNGSPLPGSTIHREHVMPKSWWGGSTSVTQYKDFHNLFPADAGTNISKSSLPLGIVGGSIGSYPYATFPMTDVGLDAVSCTNIDSGTTSDDKVFEPDDGYKGDFARVFLYMSVRYQDEIITENWKGFNAITTAVFSNDMLTIYEPCLLALMLQWHNQDPPSPLEIDRNNAISLTSYQGNRNPFIDHPEYANLIWDGTCTGEPMCMGVDLAINFDASPQQTAWEILDDTGNIVASSTGTYTGTSALETTCLADGCYSLVVSDSGNDGMCPRRTTTVLTGINIANLGLGGVFNGIPRVGASCGDYTLTDADGTVLASGGGRFGSSETSNFCISGGVAALVAPNHDDSFLANQIQENAQLSIHPNIVQDEIRMNYSTENNRAQFHVTNVNGQVLAQSTGNKSGDITLNVSHLQAGYYFVQMISDNEVITKRFIVSR